MNARPITRILAVAAAAALCVGCAGISPEGRRMLQESPSCDNAQASVELLQADRAGAGLRVVQGAQCFMPPLVVLSVLRDIYGKPFRSIYLDHWRIAFGSYNRQIDERITELKACP